jgi:hypothetical protein
MGEVTIDDLLNALQNPEKPDGNILENNKDTWSRIGNKDNFSELGLETSELDVFLTEWCAKNDYNNI